ncbi:MAG: type II toxin-antitoxin system RelE/ParE family toxin [Pseudomonadota bacterium]
MTYSIIRTKQADKDLRKLPKNIALKIINKLEKLAVDPYKINNNVTALSGNDAFRLRVGNYRAIYYLEDDKLILTLVRIKHRKEVYDEKY